MIFGPIDDYSLAPVSRFAGVWGIPIVSPGGFAEAFTITKQVYICTQFLFLSAPFIIFIFIFSNVLPSIYYFIAPFRMNSFLVRIQLRNTVSLKSITVEFFSFFCFVLAMKFRGKQPQFPTLSRMFGSYEHVGNALHGLFRQLNWHIISLMYHNHGEATGRGNSDCSFSLSAIQRNFKNTTSFHENFDEERATRNDFQRMLAKFKQQSRSELYNPITIFDLITEALNFLFFFCLISYIFCDKFNKLNFISFQL